MSDDLLDALPMRHGHFRLESGLHTDCWLTLDALFVDPVVAAPMIAALAERLRPHAVTAVCGPLLGGAFLAHALASRLGVRFYYAEQAPPAEHGGLFHARYRLPSQQARRAPGERMAVVDDAISAGSSVRSTVAGLTDVGATVAVVGTPLLLGDVATAHFGASSIPIEALERRALDLWEPDTCPLCRSGMPIEEPLA
jgi:orotate phosphoribosyltransferase